MSTPLDQLDPGALDAGEVLDAPQGQQPILGAPDDRTGTWMSVKTSRPSERSLPERASSRIRCTVGVPQWRAKSRAISQKSHGVLWKSSPAMCAAPALASGNERGRLLTASSDNSAPAGLRPATAAPRSGRPCAG